MEGLFIFVVTLSVSIWAYRKFKTHRIIKTIGIWCITSTIMSAICGTINPSHVKPKKEVVEQLDSAKIVRDNLEAATLLCEQHVIIPNLKDPDSYRRLNRYFDQRDSTTWAVTVIYTAANSFGGRVKQQNTFVFEDVYNKCKLLKVE